MADDVKYAITIELDPMTGDVQIQGAVPSVALAIGMCEMAKKHFEYDLNKQRAMIDMAQARLSQNGKNSKSPLSL